MSALAEVTRKVSSAPHTLGADDLDCIRAANLGGYVRPRLPANHPLRGALRADFLNHSARHALIRAELRPLLRVWADAGIPVILMKGFALAEFEYASPGERFYGDVDLLLPDDPETISRAVHLALAHGWRSDGQHARPEGWTHECAHLYGPGGHTKLDVHRFVVAWTVGPQGRVRRLTEQVWEAAAQTDWDGLPVLRPSPADGVVVNLALGRCWGDAGGLKPADCADLSLLQSRHQLRPEDLARRAQALGVARTWAAFQAVCQPGHPEYAAALGGHSPTLRRAAQQGSALAAARLVARLRQVPRLTFWMLRLLPDIVAAGHTYRQRTDPRPTLLSWGLKWGAPIIGPVTGPVAGTAAGRLDLPTQGHIVSAARWWTRLLYPRQAKRGVCLPRAYATYRALRRYGHPAVFVSGVARTAHGVTGHAWVEDDRGVMEAYGEPLVRLRFTESFRIPARRSEGQVIGSQTPDSDFR